MSNRWLIRELDLLPELLALELELPPGATIAAIKRVRLVDGTPLSLETMFIPEQFLPHPDRLDGSLYAHWLEQGIEPDVQEYVLSICPAAEDAELLSVSPTASLMKIILKSRDQLGRVLEYGTVICRSDFYHFHFMVKASNSRQ